MSQVERKLSAGLLACPDCEGRLSPWGYARALLASLAGSATGCQVMVSVPENEDLRPIADDAGRRIRAALDTLNSS